MKNMIRRARLSFLILALALTGCEDGTIAGIANKSASITTSAELEKVLGKPQSIEKSVLGQKWKYKATDGEVAFIISADKVQMRLTNRIDKK